MTFLNPGDKQFYLGNIDFCKIEAKSIAIAYLDYYPELRRWMNKVKHQNTISRRVFRKRFKK